MLVRNVTENCAYSVCVSVGIADRLSDVEVNPAAMVLAGEVCKA